MTNILQSEVFQSEINPLLCKVNQRNEFNDYDERTENTAYWSGRRK